MVSKHLTILGTRNPQWEFFKHCSNIETYIERSKADGAYERSHEFEMSFGPRINEVLNRNLIHLLIEINLYLETSLLIHILEIIKQDFDNNFKCLLKRQTSHLLHPGLLLSAWHFCNMLVPGFQCSKRAVTALHYFHFPSVSWMVCSSDGCVLSETWFETVFSKDARVPHSPLALWMLNSLYALPCCHGTCQP